jgi:DNA polymerase
MITYALDFETYYDKHCSIRKLGPLGYFSHYDFDAYMVSVVGDDGYEWVGHPENFDWTMLNGNIVLSHNASFDETLYLYGINYGWWPKVEPAEWHCTADMAAAVGLPRSLKNSTAEAFDLEISKSTRDNMSGKTWTGMTKEFQKEVEEYAIKDSVLCLRLWKAYESKWSQFERAISVTNRRIVQRGIPIDIDALRKAKETINELIFETEKAIPWADEKPLLSRKAFDEHCIKLGIEPPASLAKTDVDAQRWILAHGHKYKWIEAVTNWRRINTIKKKLDSFDYATMPDNRYYGGIMYFGGHTGRFSGSGGNLNLQNLPREGMFGVNMRNLITAPKGKKLVVVDLSQIEVRTLCWLSGDRETMDAIEKSDDIYEAFAIQFGLWSGDRGVLKKEDAKLRHKVKALVLGCGYGAGAKRFAEMYDMPQQEAQDAVNLYRRKLAKVPRYWKKLDKEVDKAYNAGRLSLTLPSGRSLNYGNLRKTLAQGRVQFVSSINRNGQKRIMKLWGGVLAENLSQALARDIFSFMMLEIDKAGIDIIFHVHDEVICECDEDKAEEILQKITQIMSTPPEWISDIPLDAEGEILTQYQK